MAVGDQTLFRLTATGYETYGLCHPFNCYYVHYTTIPIHCINYLSSRWGKEDVIWDHIVQSPSVVLAVAIRSHCTEQQAIPVDPAPD